MGNSKEIYFLS